MKYKKIINLLLVAILTATVLPLKQVGNLLFKNQLTEEISEGHDSPVKKSDGKFDINKYTFACDLATNVHSQLPVVGFYGSFNSLLPLSPVKDIHTPPPNLF